MFDFLKAQKLEWDTHIHYTLGYWASSGETKTIVCSCLQINALLVSFTALWNAGLVSAIIVQWTKCIDNIVIHHTPTIVLTETFSGISPTCAFIAVALTVVVVGFSRRAEIKPARSGPGLWIHFEFLWSACSFCISICIAFLLPMQFVQKRAQKSTIIVHGCEQPRFQWTLSRSLPTTGFYDSVYSSRVRHRSRFLLYVASPVVSQSCAI